MNREEVLRKLRELKPLLAAQYKVRDIGLFGSFVRQEQRPDSDIDILVKFEDGADLFDLVRLGQHLEKLLGHPVDVVSREALRKELRQTVIEEMVVV